METNEDLVDGDKRLDRCVEVRFAKKITTKGALYGTALGAGKYSTAAGGNNGSRFIYEMPPVESPRFMLARPAYMAKERDCSGVEKQSALRETCLRIELWIPGELISICK